MPEENLENVKKYGYPFGPNDWTFHSTVDSFSEKEYKNFWPKIKKYDLEKRWKVKHIAIYINLGKDGFKLYKRYNLGGG